MNPYRYKVSLRFHGGDFDPDDVSRTLALPPRKQWRAGDDIINPPGTPSRGKRAQTFWFHPFEIPDNSSVEDSISAIVDSLLLHRDWLRDMRTKGVLIELFIGLFGSKNFGFTISYVLTQRLAETGLDLAFDVYPEAETENTESSGAANAASLSG